MKQDASNSFNRPLPPLWLSVIPLVVLVILISLAVTLYGDESLGGASQIVLLISAGLCVALGRIAKLLTFEDFEQAIADKISSVSVALLILLLIGALSGSWMISGVVPTLIYYGMQILHPIWFLTAACIICAVVSLMTGSSWTTIATIGIALMAIGQALGFSPGWVAGAIISGAYFGDKMSPLSDTTVMAASTVGVPLFVHIRFMTRTVIPSFGTALVVYTLVGWLQSAQGESQVDTIQQGLLSTFFISPWLLLVPAITGYLIIKRLPTLVILFSGILLATIVAIFTQSDLLYTIADNHDTSANSIIKGILTMLHGETHLTTGVDTLDRLVATHGMSGMTSTIWLIISAMIFGAAMTASGMIDSIVAYILRFAKGPITLVISTVVTSLLFNLIMCDQYLSIITTSSMYKEAYLRHGCEARLLSRSIEDSATVTSPIIPWNSCGLTQSSVLGVSTLVYAPFCIFNWISPIVTILSAPRKK